MFLTIPLVCCVVCLNDVVVVVVVVVVVSKGSDAPILMSCLLCSMFDCGDGGVGWRSHSDINVLFVVQYVWLW